MLSKSQFIRGIKCHKSLWLYKNRADLRDAPDANQEALFESGYQTGDFAKSLFPNGIEIEFDSSNFQGMIENTSKLIKEGIDTIYEAAFSKDGLFAMADILHRGEHGWELYEVKASTSVKEYHLLDAAFQYKLIKSTGLQISKIAIIHINNFYTRDGELKPKELFTIADITEDVLGLQDEIALQIEMIGSMLLGDEPEVDIGEWCGKFYECDFGSHCWNHIPTTSVFNLYKLGGPKKFELYYKGVISYEDVLKHHIPNRVQKIQIDTHQTKEPHVDSEVIEEFLREIKYPINFFDFETMQDAIPRFQDQRPYQQIPFQYSLHILHEDGRVEHREFLADENSDPRTPLIEKMLEDITTEGSIVAFNQSFEIGKIKDLAKTFPEFSDALLNLIPRFIDLIVPFRGLGYYHPDFNGSFSIKSVLPAMFPNHQELNYKNLVIQEGGAASSIFASLYLLKDKNQKEKIRTDLLAYCKLDTLAMVELYKKLCEIKTEEMNNARYV